MAEESDIFLEGAQHLTGDYTPTIPNLVTEVKMELMFEQAKLDEINADSTTAKVFLIGMPSEVGVRALVDDKLGAKPGAERGPESFREIIPLCAMPGNPVDSDISLLGTVKIYDCGNMPVN